MMAMITPLGDPGLVVRSTHWVIEATARAFKGPVAAALRKEFRLNPLGRPGPKRLERMLRDRSKGPKLVVAWPGGKAERLTPRPELLERIPARLAGGLICLVGGGRAAMEVMFRDAGLHKSPSAGWPEAATAASLGVALAGPRVYGGAVTDDPYLNAEGREAAGPVDIEAAVRLIWRAWAGLLVVAALAALLGR